MKKLSILFLLMTGILTFSCSDDDNDANIVDNTPTVTSLALTSDIAEGMIGDVFTFTVNASLSDGTTVDVTSNSDFTIDDELISNPFTSLSAGVFTVTSTFNDASTTLDITVTETTTSLDLTSDIAEGMIGDVFTFTVIANLSDGSTVDVTTNSTFTVANASISNPFTPTEAGVFTVTSTFNDASTTLDITVTEPVPPTTYLDFNFDDLDVTDWTFIDNDGDGDNWNAVQINDVNAMPVGTPVLRSTSWNGAPQTPDNFAVSPAIDLSTEDGSRMITLTWDVSAADPDFANENYTVYASTENTIAGLTSSSISLNELVTDNGPGGIDNVYTKTLDLTALAGSVVYVAFRHHISTDVFSIEIDNVTVIAGSDSGRVSNNNNEFVGNIDGVLLRKDLE